MTVQESAAFYRDHYLKSPMARECYDQLVRRIESGKYTASQELPNMPLHCAADEHQAYIALRHDRPEFFFLNNDCHTMQRDHTVIMLAEEVYNAKLVSDVWKEAERLCNQLISDLPEDQLEREVALYKRMASLLRYKKDERIISFKCHNIINPVMKHDGVCEGIAKLFVIVMRKAGIPAILIYGETHAWNMVWIDDNPMYCDLTWDLQHPSTPEFINRTDSILDSNHNPVLKIFPPCHVRPRWSVKSKFDPFDAWWLFMKPEICSCPQNDI